MKKQLPKRWPLRLRVCLCREHSMDKPCPNNYKPKTAGGR